RRWTCRAGADRPAKTNSGGTALRHRYSSSGSTQPDEAWPGIAGGPPARVRLRTTLATPLVSTGPGAGLEPTRQTHRVFLREAAAHVGRADQRVPRRVLARRAGVAGAARPRIAAPVRRVRPGGSSWPGGS